jgi:hypothetical protein
MVHVPIISDRRPLDILFSRITDTPVTTASPKATNARAPRQPQVLLDRRETCPHGERNTPRSQRGLLLPGENKNKNKNTAGFDRIRTRIPPIRLAR